MAEHAPGEHAHEHGPVAADSAGHPWAGRTFQHHDTAFAGDDGRADPRLLEALRRFAADEVGEREVVDALRTARLLVPLVAVAGDEGRNDHGVRVDKTQELSIVTVAGPDGREVLPAFTSVAALQAWRPEARPVPVEARRVALAAASEGTELVVLDPASPTEFGLRRPAVWAVAQDLAWLPSHQDEQVLAAFLEAAAGEPAVSGVLLAPGVVGARLDGPELVVQLGVRPGLDRDALTGLLERLRTAWASHPVVTERVDSLAVRVVAA